MTSALSENELLLYRVLKRANLSQYYDAFISQGGDDLYQLCEAGEDEFLEIMVLVGMSKKPLHVRRLQKALHEWASNPGVFQDSEDAVRLTTGQISKAPKGSILAAFLQHSSSPNVSTKLDIVSQDPHLHLSNRFSLERPDNVLSSNGGNNNKNNNLPQIHSYRSLRVNSDGNIDGCVDKPGSPMSEISDQDTSLTGYMNSSGEKLPTSPVASGAQLLDAHVKRIERTAEEISNGLPYYAPKPLNMKKTIDKEIDEAMNVRDDDPNRMDLFRKYSAIYGRFDSKRRGSKQMNFHEVCINEAAAQLCKHRPSLLTRREELFILARQVVREAGFQYSKGNRPKDSFISASVSDEVPAKRPKLDIISPAVQDLSFSKHKFNQPASINIGVYQDGAAQEGDVGNFAPDSIISGVDQARNKVDRFLFKTQQNSASPRISTAETDLNDGGDENSALDDEIDEQKAWQREVGLDSLNITTQRNAGETVRLHGSSIVQALRDGMRAVVKYNKINSIIKSEKDS